MSLFGRPRYDDRNAHPDDERLADWYSALLVRTIEKFRLPRDIAEDIYNELFTADMANVLVRKTEDRYGRIDERMAFDLLYSELDRIVDELNRSSRGFGTFANTRSTTAFGNSRISTDMGKSSLARHMEKKNQGFAQEQRQQYVPEPEPVVAQPSKKYTYLKPVPAFDEFPIKMDMIYPFDNIKENEDPEKIPIQYRPTNKLCSVDYVATLTTAYGLSDILRIQMNTPFYNPTQVIKLLTQTIPAANNPNVILDVHYQQIMCQKVSSHLGVETAETFNRVREKINSVRTIEEFSSAMAPMASNLKAVEYINALLMNTVNKYLKAYFTSLEDPTKSIICNDWSSLSEFRNLSVPMFREFLPKDDTDVSSWIWTCIRSAICSIVGEDQSIVLTPEGDNKGIICSIPDLYVALDKYLPRDYGTMPSDLWAIMEKKIKEDYIIHLVDRNVIFARAEYGKCVASTNISLVNRDAVSHPLHIYNTTVFEMQIDQFRERGTNVLFLPMIYGLRETGHDIYWHKKLGYLLSGHLFYHE